MDRGALFGGCHRRADLGRRFGLGQADRAAYKARRLGRHGCPPPVAHGVGAAVGRVRFGLGDRRDVASRRRTAAGSADHRRRGQPGAHGRKHHARGDRRDGRGVGPRSRPGHRGSGRDSRATGTTGGCDRWPRSSRLDAAGDSAGAAAHPSPSARRYRRAVDCARSAPRPRDEHAPPRELTNPAPPSRCESFRLASVRFDGQRGLRARAGRACRRLRLAPDDRGRRQPDPCCAERPGRRERGQSDPRCGPVGGTGPDGAAAVSRSAAAARRCERLLATVERVAAHTRSGRDAPRCRASARPSPRAIQPRASDKRGVAPTRTPSPRTARLARRRSRPRHAPRGGRTRRADGVCGGTRARGGRRDCVRRRRRCARRDARSSDSPVDVGPPVARAGALAVGTPDPSPRAPWIARPVSHPCPRQPCGTWMSRSTLTRERRGETVI
jgi:hypothetical protein